MQLLKEDEGAIHSLTVFDYNQQQHLAYSNSAGLVKLLRLEGPAGIITTTNLRGHDNKIVFDLKYNPIRKQLISAGSDGSIRIWDVDNMENFPIVIEDNKAWVISIAISPGGENVLAGCQDRVLRAYPLSSSALAATLKIKIDRNFTKEEWDKYVGEDIPFRDVNNFSIFKLNQNAGL